MVLEVGQEEEIEGSRLLHDAKISMVDALDASYKIHSFLDTHLSHFTQNFKADDVYIQNLLDLLSLESTVVPQCYRFPYHNLIGFLYTCLGKLDKALKYFDLVLTINSEDSVALVNKAKTFLLRDDLEPVYPIIRQLQEIDTKANYAPGTHPVSIAQYTIGFAYCKLGLSCAAVKFFSEALNTDPYNYNATLGKGEVLLRLSYHEGRLHRIDMLNKSLKCVRAYINEYNVLNLSNNEKQRTSPLPRNDKGAKHVYAVLILIQVLNERHRITGSVSGTELMDLVLSLYGDNAYALMAIGDEKRKLKMLDGERGAVSLLKRAVGLCETGVLYHHYAMAILQREQLCYEERVSLPQSEEPDTANDPEANENKKKKNASSKGDKSQAFVFEGDDKLKQAYTEVAKLLKHALKLSRGYSTDINMDLANIYCSLCRKRDAEIQFKKILSNGNQLAQAVAYRKMGVFLIKINDIEKGEEYIEKAILMKDLEKNNPGSLKELTHAVEVLSHFYSSENSTKSKYWTEKLAEFNPDNNEDHQQSKNTKHAKERKK